jgi:flavin-dependent dehydrogenase
VPSERAVRRTPVLIVGGGPAGSAAAISLARLGVAAELIERSSEPHDSVCGGFLGWDALSALAKLGVDPAALGARPITRLRLISAGGRVEAPLPRPAAGLSRRTLDACLLDTAAGAGTTIHRGRAVKAADLDALIVRLDEGEEMAADALLLATGKYELRGAPRPRDTSADPVGLRTALAASPALGRALDGMIELHLFDGGYAGLLLQEDGSANLCLSVARARLKRAGGVEPLIAELAAEVPILAKRLGQGEPGDWSAVAGVPYGWRAGGTAPGVFRLGDQGAVIASLAGDGIAIALASGITAAESLARGDSAQVWQTRFSRRARRPIAVAEALRWAAEHERPRKAMMGLLRAAPPLPALAARLTRIGS